MGQQTSVDHLVRTAEQRGRNDHTKCFGRLKVDSQNDFSRLFHRYFRHFGASQELRDLTSALTKNYAETGTIGNQAACLSLFRPLQNGWQAMQIEAVTD